MSIIYLIYFSKWKQEKKIYIIYVILYFKQIKKDIKIIKEDIKYSGNIKK